METKEPQYQVQIDTHEKAGPVTLGVTTSHIWRSDPRHLLFFLARYKFVAKMLVGYEHALEIGCGDGFGSRLVTQNNIKVTAVDFDPVFIAQAQEREEGDPLRRFEVNDFCLSPMNARYDAAYSLDVIEHIQPKDEATFLGNVCASLKDNGICIFGSPSIESQLYASIWSKAGHVNCKSALDWRKTLLQYFEHVFVFGMNDEVLHTGYYAMSHYVFCLCVMPRRSGRSRD